MENNFMASSLVPNNPDFSYNPPQHVVENQPQQENLVLTTPPANRRPRGRPVGSKNKPKTDLAAIPQPSARVIIINVDSGKDVMESIFDLAHQNHVSLNVLSASGTITCVNLCTLANSTVTAPTLLYGPFNLISLHGSYLHSDHYTLQPGATPPLPSPFRIHLSTFGGRLFGGLISGRLIARDDVRLTLSTFKNSVIAKYVPEGDQYNNDPNDFNWGGFGNQFGINIHG